MTTTPTGESLKRRDLALQIARQLSAVPGVTSLVVFGSVATGEARVDSDLDLIGTYGVGYDRAAWDAVCRAVGWDKEAISSSADPLTTVTPLKVDGVMVGVILGPESHLHSMLTRVQTSDVQQFHGSGYRSFAHAIVLLDNKGLWPPVVEAVRQRAKELAVSI